MDTSEAGRQSLYRQAGNGPVPKILLTRALIGEVYRCL